MKKFILVLAVLLLAGIGVMAAPGDVMGQIYSTDILAYVNGSQINSYNIGGRTVVLAEELCNNNTGEHYGFECIYDNDTRTLTVNSTFTEGNVDPVISRGTVGEIIGNIYETDIKVFFNSHEITGYNIGGLTAICIEDLGAYTEGENNAAYGYSKYLCNSVWNPELREISLNSFMQDRNYFGNYPSKKLAFVLNDNQLSCTFDQLNPFKSTFTFNFSDQFKNDICKIKPIIFGGETVGQMIMKSNGMAVYSINDFMMHKLTSNLEVVLSYDEAKKYVADNFEIAGEKEDENATIYLAKKDGVHYLLFAMKNGGLVCDSKYDSSYTSLELITENEVHSLKMDSPNFEGSMPVSTLGYDFTDDYENYIGFSIPEADRRSTRTGVATIKIDELDCTVNAIEAYGYNSEILVDLETMVTLLDTDYHMFGGVFYFAPNEKKALSISQFDSDGVSIPQSLTTLTASKVYVNGQPGRFTYTSPTGVKTAVPYYYGGAVYVPFSFFTELYK